MKAKAKSNFLVMVMLVELRLKIGFKWNFKDIDFKTALMFNFLFKCPHSFPTFEIQFFEKKCEFLSHFL